MKKTTVIFLVIACCALKAAAQKETKNFSVGLGIEAGAPTGNYSSIYTSYMGLTIRFSYHAGPGFVTLTTGALGFPPKKVAGEPSKLGLQLPVLAGYKYIIQHHFFMMGELGFASTKTYYGSQGKLLSVSQGSFIAAPSVGVQFNVFEISLRYEMDFKDQGGIIGPRIGFNF
jgi:hypothetical protein